MYLRVYIHEERILKIGHLSREPRSHSSTRNRPVFCVPCPDTYARFLAGNRCPLLVWPAILSSPITKGKLGFAAIPRPPVTQPPDLLTSFVRIAQPRGQRLLISRPIYLLIGDCAGGPNFCTHMDE